VQDTPRVHAPRARTPADQEQVAQARVRFLTADHVDDDEVRDAILASWWRSRRSQVAADNIAVPYVRNPDLDLPLVRSAQPIMHQLAEQLEGQPVSLILTDPSGVVLRRLTGDADLQRHLEHVSLAPGFSYAEDQVGTNGIGTALADGVASHVFGHEHYAEYLEELACAGVPIRHPVTGKTVGAVDLTCWRKDAGPLLSTLAKTAADQITRALLTDSGVRELELFRAYLQACRRTTGMVLALNNDVVIMNDLARQLLGPQDQAALLKRAAEEMAEPPRVPSQVTLPSGNLVRLTCRPVHGGGHVTGGIVHVTLVTPEDHGLSEAGPSAAPLLRMYLPGLVGAAPSWLHACHEADRAYAAGEWLILSGEPGVGKLALAQAVHQRHDPSHRFRVLDAAADAGQYRFHLSDVRAQLSDESTRALVIRHVDQLDADTLHALTEVMTAAREARAPGTVPWVAVTEHHSTPEMEGLRALFPSTVEVPPLRHRMEDLRELVSFFLSRLGRGGPLRCSPEVMHLLQRSTWPGNTAQVYRVLSHVVQHHRRSGSIQPHELPPEYHAVSRRPLSHLESIERDAIVESLLLCGGNKAEAAKALGMSRATIYRRIHEYGIVTVEGTGERDPRDPPRDPRGAFPVRS
jgi:sigma-54 dependent transcriptional regulator, acetoin dehydrogenase operon transcriptional activator AcoR